MVRAAEPQELDVQALLRLFLRRVDAGAPAGYATFRECWQQMQFSFVYEVRLGIACITAEYDSICSNWTYTSGLMDECAGPDIC